MRYFEFLMIGLRTGRDSDFTSNGFAGSTLWLLTTDFVILLNSICPDRDKYSAHRQSGSARDAHVNYFQKNETIPRN